jgi:hypothetical protein
MALRSQGGKFAGRVAPGISAPGQLVKTLGRRPARLLAEIS